MTRRFQVMFTPVGWHVVDTVEARDPIAEFGLGREEYSRAKAEADWLNGQTRPTKRVSAQCVLLEIALRQAIDDGLRRQASIDHAIHESRQLRREIRRMAA